MKEPASQRNEPASTRILFHALVGALAITSALILRTADPVAYRSGSMLLLFSGVLFAAVVIIDSTRKLRNPEERITTRKEGEGVRVERTYKDPVVRRIRRPRPIPHAATAGPDCPGSTENPSDTQQADPLGAPAYRVRRYDHSDDHEAKLSARS